MAADEIKSTSTVQQLVDPFGLLPPLNSQPYLFFKRGLLLSTATATFHLKVSKVSSYLQSPRSLFTVGKKNTSSDRITIFATMDTPDQPASVSDKTKISSVTDISLKMDTPDQPASESDKTDVSSVTGTAPDTRTVKELNQSKIKSLTEELERLQKERDDLKAICDVLRARIDFKKKGTVPTSEMNDRMSEALQRWILLSEQR
ncbi:hypothetical protein K456DRAFT_41129 [Colletotrichum gloeosporioides 23]|nr:hypothetical protein K456DRAFT_41129 [Colletotrichum gloeosporioides 23]